MSDIVFDIDGTLTLVGDRVKELQKSPPDWDAFYARCGEDEPNYPIMLMFQMFARGITSNVWLLTGRRESCRQDTIDWFVRHTPMPAKYIDVMLFMRPDGDHRHDTEVKPELLKNANIEPSMIFEDRNSMVKKWRELGYTCLQVADGDF